MHFKDMAHAFSFIFLLVFICAFIRVGILSSVTGVSLRHFYLRSQTYY